MALQKLANLAAYIKGKNLVAEEQIDFWMETAKLSPASKRLGNGLLVCRFQYDGILVVERYTGNADLFLALICCWLQDHDEDRDQDELPEPDADVTTLDDLTVDVAVKITFTEDITVIEDVNGLIDFGDKKYSLADVEISVADSVGVGDSQERATDLVYVRN